MRCLDLKEHIQACQIDCCHMGVSVAFHFAALLLYLSVYRIFQIISSLSANQVSLSYRSTFLIWIGICHPLFDSTYTCIVSWRGGCSCRNCLQTHSGGLWWGGGLQQAIYDCVTRNGGNSNFPSSYQIPSLVEEYPPFRGKMGDARWKDCFLSFFHTARFMKSSLPINVIKSNATVSQQRRIRCVRIHKILAASPRCGQSSSFRRWKQIIQEHRLVHSTRLSSYLIELRSASTKAERVSALRNRILSIRPATPRSQNRIPNEE